MIIVVSQLLPEKTIIEEKYDYNSQDTITRKDYYRGKI
jgi:hypothetical protein